MSLDNIAQQARQKKLRFARITLNLVGILTIILSSFLFSNAEQEMNDALHNNLVRTEMVFTDSFEFESFREESVRKLKLIYAGNFSVGVIFLICAALIYKSPIAATMTGFIFYIGLFAIAATTSQTINLGFGLILKIIIIVILVNAVQAAIAYQQEN